MGKSFAFCILTFPASAETESSIDNGVNISSDPPAYTVHTDLSSRIRRVNPNWNEATSDTVYDVSYS